MHAELVSDKRGCEHSANLRAQSPKPPSPAPPSPEPGVPLPPPEPPFGTCATGEVLGRQDTWPATWCKLGNRSRLGKGGGGGLGVDRPRPCDPRTCSELRTAHAKFERKSHDGCGVTKTIVTGQADPRAPVERPRGTITDNLGTGETALTLGAARLTMMYMSG